jgi:hypothetical protein
MRQLSHDCGRHRGETFDLALLSPVSAQQASGDAWDWKNVA